MSIIHLQKKIKRKKNWNLFGSGSESRTGSGSVIPDADPHQNEADLKLCF